VAVGENPIPILGRDQVIAQNQACLRPATAKHRVLLEAMMAYRSYEQLQGIYD
jgi:hypothetical protein